MVISSTRLRVEASEWWETSDGGDQFVRTILRFCRMDETIYGMSEGCGTEMDILR